jgi:hypothetical protein
MSDEEVICGWMEPKPPERNRSTDKSTADWWALDLYGVYWNPRSLTTLDALHEVEARLTDAQQLAYWLALSRGGEPKRGYWRIVHATSARKIKVLAEVIREASYE